MKSLRFLLISFFVCFFPIFTQAVPLTDSENEIHGRLLTLGRSIFKLRKELKQIGFPVEESNIKVPSLALLSQLKSLSYELVSSKTQVDFNFQKTRKEQILDAILTHFARLERKENYVQNSHHVMNTENIHQQYFLRKENVSNAHGEDLLEIADTLIKSIAIAKTKNHSSVLRFLLQYTLDLSDDLIDLSEENFTRSYTAPFFSS